VAEEQAPPSREGQKRMIAKPWDPCFRRDDNGRLRGECVHYLFKGLVIYLDNRNIGPEIL